MIGPSGSLNVGGFGLSYGGAAGAAGAAGGLGFLPSINPTATATDSGYTFENTPVSVIAGNNNVDPVALINAAANLNRVASEPIEQALSESAGLAGVGGGGAGGGGIPQWIWWALGGLALWSLVRK